MRDADLYDLYARKVENTFKRELSRLNYLFARAPSGTPPPKPHSRLGTPPQRTSPRPGALSTSNSDSEMSEGSTDAAALVGMTRVKTSTSKSVHIVGVNGCTGIFLSGAGFITGAHADPVKIPDRVRAAATEAKSHGTVTGITVYSPDSADADETANALRALFPDISPEMKPYPEDKRSKAGYWDFNARQGNPPRVTANFIPPSPPSSPK